MMMRMTSDIKTFRMTSRVRTGRRGAMLLEVIVSMGLLLFGMVMVGLQINAGLDAARQADIRTRAVMLADSRFAELDSGALVLDELETEIDGDFGIRRQGEPAEVPYPGYTWRIQVEERDVSGIFETDVESTQGLVFYALRLDIGYNESQVAEQIADPEYEIEFDDEGRKIVRTVYRLWPKPADINLARDFGMEDEQVEELLDGLEMAAQQADETGLPDELSGGGEDAMDLSTMVELLRQVMAAGGGGFDPRMLTQLPAEQYGMATELVDALFGRGDTSGLQGQLQQMFSQYRGQNGGDGPDSGEERGGRDGRPDRPERPGRPGRPGGPGDNGASGADNGPPGPPGPGGGRPDRPARPGRDR
jgi:hypothetical protein